MAEESEKTKGNDLAPAGIPKKALDAPSPLRLHIDALDCQFSGMTPSAERGNLAGAHARTG